MVGTEFPLNDQDWSSGFLLGLNKGSSFQCEQRVDAASVYCVLDEPPTNLEQTLTLDNGRILLYHNRTYQQIIK